MDACADSQFCSTCAGENVQIRRTKLSSPMPVRGCVRISILQTPSPTIDAVNHRRHSRQHLGFRPPRSRARLFGSSRLILPAHQPLSIGSLDNKLAHRTPGPTPGPPTASSIHMPRQQRSLRSVALPSSKMRPPRLHAAEEQLTPA